MASSQWLPSPAHGKTKSGRSSAVRLTMLTIALSVMSVLFMAVLFGARWTPSGGGGGGDTSWVSAGARIVFNAVSSKQGADPVVSVAEPQDRLLGGLLSPDFDESSCLSRYRALLYRRPSLHVLSSHLVSALRRYESLHRLCGPGTSAYERAVARLRSPTQPSNTSDAGAPSGCRYIVWTPHAGLGNRMLTLASAFLYALLNDRVLLFHRPGDDLKDLFCEPFPGSTWFLPEGDFPIRGMERFGMRTNESLGNVLSRGEGSREPPPPWMYVHLRHDYTRGAADRLFFCDEGQDALQRVDWLVLLSDNYFLPGLFLIPRYEHELSRMFPSRDAVFHHLGRYLFHPSNTVWGMVMRYHGSYMAAAEERIGIQVRTFQWAPIATDELYSQIISCAHGESILPHVREPSNANATGAQPGSGQPATRKAVLVVSLHGEYYERIKDLYYEHGAADGEAVSVFQPTHLDRQRSEERLHNQKALAEMMLLSFCDVVLTSAASTFGYVSHGLAGLRPWVLMSPVNKKAPNPPCRLAATIEPCFHSPPHYDCRTKARGDDGKVVRHVRHCEDFKNGVQLVD